MTTLEEIKQLVEKVNELEKESPLASPDFKNLKTDLISRFWTGVLVDVMQDLSVGQLSAALIVLKFNPSVDDTVWGNGASILDQLLNGYNKDYTRVGVRRLVAGHDLWAEDSLNEEAYNDITHSAEQIRQLAISLGSNSGGIVEDDSEGGAGESIQGN
jgi:hypothetical protein